MAGFLPIDDDCVLYEGVPETPEARRRLVRRFLSDRLGVPESDLQLSTTPAGQPVIKNRGSLAVSWAHRSHFLFIGMAKGCVGVDLELADHALPVGDLVAAFFCKNERRLMRRLVPGARLEAFFLLWTLREAYLKALGHGLDAPVAHELDFSVILRGRPALEDVAQTICGPGLARAWMISRMVLLEGRRLRLTKIAALEEQPARGETKLRQRPCSVVAGVGCSSWSPASSWGSDTSSRAPAHRRPASLSLRRRRSSVPPSCPCRDPNAS